MKIRLLMISLMPALVLMVSLGAARSHADILDFEDALGAVPPSGSVSAASPVSIGGVDFSSASGTVFNRGSAGGGVPFSSDWLELGLPASIAIPGSAIISTGSGLSILALGRDVAGAAQSAIVTVSYSDPGVCSGPASVTFPAGVLIAPFFATISSVGNCGLTFSSTTEMIVGLDDFGGAWFDAPDPPPVPAVHMTGRVLIVVIFMAVLVGRRLVLPRQSA